MVPEKIEIMPYGVSISFRQKNNKSTEKSKKYRNFEIKKIIIALAGPLTNLIIILIALKFKINYIVSNEIIVYSNLLILVFNLLPIYPLDGGRILKGLFHIIIGKNEDVTNKISNATAIIFTVFSSICTYYYKNIAFFLITMFIWGLVIRENKKYRIKKRVIKILDRKNSKSK